MSNDDVRRSINDDAMIFRCISNLCELQVVVVQQKQMEMTDIVFWRNQCEISIKITVSKWTVYGSDPSSLRLVVVRIALVAVFAVVTVAVLALIGLAAVTTLFISLSLTHTHGLLQQLDKLVCFKCCSTPSTKAT